MTDRFVIEVYNLNPRVFMWRFPSSILPSVGDYIRKDIWEGVTQTHTVYYQVKYRSIFPQERSSDCSIFTVYVEETTGIPTE